MYLPVQENINNHNLFYMSKIENFLSNTKMGRLIASYLGKTNLAVDEKGKVSLTDEEKEKIRTMYGADFLAKFEAMDFNASEDNARELFDSAVQYKAQELAASKDAIIAHLQSQVATLSAESEPAPKSQAVAGVASKSFVADMALSHNKAAHTFLQSGSLSAANPTIEVAALNAELGAYLSQGNNLDILRQLYQGFTTAKHLNWKRAVTEYKAVMAESVSHIVQQFKAAWNPKGGAKFNPLTIRNYRHKVDFSINPTEVGEGWLFHLYDERKTPDQMPITRYIVNNILLPQIAEDIELVMIGKAKYVADSEETHQTMDGIETQLVEAQKSSDSKMRFFKDATNLLNASDEIVLNTINAFVDAVAPLYKTKQMPIFLSDDLYIKYKRAYKNKWGAGSGTEKTNFGADRVDFSNFYLQTLDCLTGSPIFFSTPKQNFIGLQHKNPPQFITDIQKHDREVRFYCEFWLGVGFLLAEAVFAYVPADYDPASAVADTRVGADGKWVVPADSATGVSEEGDNTESA